MKRQFEKTIGNIINEYLKDSQLENRVWEERIAEVWQATLGDLITRETDRIHLAGGHLFITLRSSALKTELMMRRSAIARALNERLGQEVIKNVVIR